MWMKERASNAKRHFGIRVGHVIPYGCDTADEFLYIFCTPPRLSPPRTHAASPLMSHDTHCCAHNHGRKHCEPYRITISSQQCRKLLMVVPEGRSFLSSANLRRPPTHHDCTHARIVVTLHTRNQSLLIEKEHG